MSALSLELGSFLAQCILETSGGTSASMHILLSVTVLLDDPTPIPSTIDAQNEEHEHLQQ